jgi:molybdate transport system permease protein
VIVAYLMLSFAGSLGEFGATITFVSNIPSETRTIASAIYTLTQTPGGDIGALRLTLASIALSFVALIAPDLLARRLGRRLSGD